MPEPRRIMLNPAYSKSKWIPAFARMTMGGSMDSRVRKDDGTMGLNGGSGRLTAKQNARYPNPSRRGRRSHQKPFPAGPPVLPRPGDADLPGRSGRLAAKQNARCSTPSRRGRRSYQDLEMGIIPVGAVAWPRSRMHGTQPFATRPSLPPETLPGGAAGPTKSWRWASSR